MKISGCIVNSIQVKAVYGGQKVIVKATFTINGEDYEVSYNRQEPSGIVWVDDVQIPSPTTEHTLDPNAIIGEGVIEEYCNG